MKMLEMLGFIKVAWPSPPKMNWQKDTSPSVRTLFGCGVNLLPGCKGHLVDLTGVNLIVCKQRELPRPQVQHFNCTSLRAYHRHKIVAITQWNLQIMHTIVFWPFCPLLEQTLHFCTCPLMEATLFNQIVHQHRYTSNT